MKSLLLAALVVSTISSVQARSILVFKTTDKCQSVKKGEPTLVLVQAAQDGQTQLVISNPLQTGTAPTKIQTKKISPPPMNAGGDVKYVGVNEVTKENVKLQFNGPRPIKVGSVTGRSATLTLEKQDAISLICTRI